MPRHLRSLMIFGASCLFGTLYAVLIGLISNRLRTPLIAWPILIVMFWYAFWKWNLFRLSGYLAVLPVSILSFEVVRATIYPKIYAHDYKTIDQSHYVTGVRIPMPEFINTIPEGHGRGLKEILIGRDGFRADPNTGQGNPERCALALIGDSMIYGSGLPYSDTLRPVLATMGVDACVFGVGGNYPVNYLATLRHVAKRIEKGAHVAMYLNVDKDFSGKDFVWDFHVLSRSPFWQFISDLIIYADKWRWATFTHRLFHQQLGDITQPLHIWQLKIGKTKTLKFYYPYDPARYTPPPPLEKWQRAYIEFFFMSLLDIVRDQPWHLWVVMIPDDKEVMKNLADQTPIFHSLDQRRIDAFEICRTFWSNCEDLAPYLYKRTLDEGKNPYFIDNWHFSAFGTRIVAEHYLAVTKRRLTESAAD